MDFSRWDYLEYSDQDDVEYDGYALVEKKADRLKITVPGHTWITGYIAPKIEGWRCKMVSHFGTERTEFTYLPA